jgi:hypothetical protein
MDRASLTFCRTTVRQPAVDARLDVHREPVSLLVSFGRTFWQGTMSPAVMSASLQPTLE